MCIHCCPASVVVVPWCIADVFVRIIEVLRSEFKDVEVVDLPLFDVQFNDSVVAKMSLQDWRCDTLGVDVCKVVVGGNSLDVHEAGLDVSAQEVAQGDVLGALVEPKLVAEAECRCAVGKDVKICGWHRRSQGSKVVLSVEVAKVEGRSLKMMLKLLK